MNKITRKRYAVFKDGNRIGAIKTSFSQALAWAIKNGYCTDKILSGGVDIREVQNEQKK